MIGRKDQLAIAERICHRFGHIAARKVIDSYFWTAFCTQLFGEKVLTALFKIGYGLYVVTSNDGSKDNGLIVNTVSQVTDSPNRVAVCINKVQDLYSLLTFFS